MSTEPFDSKHPDSKHPDSIISEDFAGYDSARRWERTVIQLDPDLTDETWRTLHRYEFHCDDLAHVGWLMSSEYLSDEFIQNHIADFYGGLSAPVRIVYVAPETEPAKPT